VVHVTKINHGGVIVNPIVVYQNAGMTRQDPQLKLRMPPELKAKIEEAAKANNRSMNSELVERLQRSFEPQSDNDSPSVVMTLTKALNKEQSRNESYEKFIQVLAGWLKMAISLLPRRNPNEKIRAVVDKMANVAQMFSDEKTFAERRFVEVNAAMRDLAQATREFAAEQNKTKDDKQ
jgi:hypothetical protein